MAEPGLLRTGVAAILAGAFICLGQAGELAFGTKSDAAEGLYVTLGAIGLAALVVAIWRLGRLTGTRVGHVGWRIAVAASVSC